jgi:hypothetical protein
MKHKLRLSFSFVYRSNCESTNIFLFIVVRFFFFQLAEESRKEVFFYLPSTPTPTPSPSLTVIDYLSRIVDPNPKRVMIKQFGPGDHVDLSCLLTAFSPLTLSTTEASNNSTFSPAEEFHQKTGTEGRPNSPTVDEVSRPAVRKGSGGLSTLLSISSGLTRPTASGCRVIEVCIPQSSRSASISEEDDAAVRVESNKVSSSRRGTLEPTTDDDVEEGSERTLPSSPRPTAKMMSKGVQVTDLRIQLSHHRIVKQKQRHQGELSSHYIQKN